jgi:hypothetical protein
LKFSFREEGVKVLKVRVRYTVKRQGAEYQEQDFYPLEVTVVQPLEFCHKWSGETDYLPAGNTATLMTSISPTACDLVIYSIALESPYCDAGLVEDLGIEPLQGKALGLGEALGSVFQLTMQHPAEGLSIGAVIVQWSRPQGTISVSRFPISRVRVLKSPFEVRLKYPAQTALQCPFSAELSVKNSTDSSLSLTFKVITHDNSFMYGGYDYLLTTVDRLQTARFSCILIPTRAGRQALPTFEVVAEGSSMQVKRTVLVLP